MKIKICNSGFYQFRYLIYKEGDTIVIDCTPHAYKETKRVGRDEFVIENID